MKVYYKHSTKPEENHSIFNRIEFEKQWEALSMILVTLICLSPKVVSRQHNVGFSESGECFYDLSF